MIPASRARPLTEVAEAIATGRLPTAARTELAPVLEALTRDMLPVTAKLNPDVRARRVVGRLLDWLEAQPGGTWQDRWDSWIGQGEQDWRPIPDRPGRASSGKRRTASTP